MLALNQTCVKIRGTIEVSINLLYIIDYYIETSIEKKITLAVEAINNYFNFR